MQKFITFEEFAAAKAKKTQVQLEQELSTKRDVAANSFKELLSEFGVASIGELSEEDRLKFNEKLGTLTESALLLEGTRGQFGIIDKRGNIQSVYTHFDSYPDNVLPLIKKHYKNSNAVNGVIAKGGNSGLDAPDKIKFYGGDLDPMTGKKSAIDSYLKKANDDGGAEYVYLYDEADKKWYMADVYAETGLVPAFESVVTEGKDDFMARYGSANINLKKGYKHHTEDELNDLYDKLGDLVKTLKVKDVTLVFESEVNEAKGFKNTEDFEAFLKEIDGMGDAQIKKIMGKNYIDTPGFYSEEAEDYDNDIIEFMTSNMGTKEFEKLQDYWENNVKESVNEAKVNSDEEFNEYATTVLQKAFGEEYDEAKAKQVVDGILAKAKGDYGAAVGMLTSSLG